MIQSAILNGSWNPIFIFLRFFEKSTKVMRYSTKDMYQKEQGHILNVYNMLKEQYDTKRYKK